MDVESLVSRVSCVNKGRVVARWTRLCVQEGAYIFLQMGFIVALVAKLVRWESVVAMGAAKLSVCLDSACVQANASIF